MNVLATMGQLRTERSLERKNWLQQPLWNLKNGTTMNLNLTLNFDRLFKVDHMVADPNP